MFYRVKVKDYVRVPPVMFGLSKEEAVLKNAKSGYAGFISKDFGFVLDVVDVTRIGEGVIVPGDGAGFYDTDFELLTFKPEMNELVYGKVRDITDFGAFLDIGGIEGMVHISQSMDDFVSFSKEKVLQGKKTGHTLKVNDQCKARIIAISFKDMNNPKVGLSMRQEGLGKLEWLEAESGAGVAGSPAEKTEKSEKAGKSKEEKGGKT